MKKFKINFEYKNGTKDFIILNSDSEDSLLESFSDFKMMSMIKILTIDEIE